MTGPSYPPAAVAGSNAIGSFKIGVSAIGDIPAFDVWKTVISQYANSSVLMQLITNFAQYLDQTANFNAFFDLIWNVDTAQGYGLDVWGRIVGVTRTLQLAGGGRFLGFEEASGLTVDPFNQSPFYAGATVTNNFQLSDDAFRVLIFAKALSNISNGTIPSINQILLNLFPGRGNAYVTDGSQVTKFITNAVSGPGGVIQLTCGGGGFNSLSGFGSGQTVKISGVTGTTEANGTFVVDVVFLPSGNATLNLRGTTFVNAYISGGTVINNITSNGNMTMTYTFNFVLTAVEAAILLQSGVLPKPVGVAATIVQL